MGTQKVCIFSYNSRGFSDIKKTFCNYLIKASGNKISILCNQENFILRANSYILDQTFSESHIVFKPAEKDQNAGRPKNGMFIAVPDSLKKTLVTSRL